MPINSQQKGKRGEREVAKMINKALGCNVRRTPGSGGLGFKGDIIDINPDSPVFKFHFEIKNQKNITIPAWIKQAEGDCSSSKTPILVYKHKGEWRMDCRFSDWLEEVDKSEY